MTIHQADSISIWFFGFFLVLWICVGLLLMFDANYNLSNIKRDINDLLGTIFLGKRIIAKINGTWCIARGFIRKKEKSAIVTFGERSPNIHYTLSYYEWFTIDSDLTARELENKVISLNIKELKAKNPRPDDFQRERDSNYGERRWNAIDDDGGVMRRYLRDMREQLDELD